jgi:hypothetical protein
MAPRQFVNVCGCGVVRAFVAKAFAYLIVGLRIPVILGWAAAVVLAVLFLPPLPSSGGLSDPPRLISGRHSV